MTCAVRRGELPGPAAGRLARLVHEMIETLVFRQLMTASAFDGDFPRYVVDDIILPQLSSTA